MTSFYSSSSVSTRERGEFSFKRQSRKRKRSTFHKFLTKTGIFFVLGVIILTSLPTRCSSRPVEDHVYGSSSQLSLEKGDAEDDESLGSRFEFQRKIISSSSSAKLSDSSSSNDDNVHSLELIRSNNSNNSNEDPLLTNSSMIVHVIVTSSSSTSSSETDETDSEPQDDTIQYTLEISDGNESGSLNLEEVRGNVSYSPITSALVQAREDLRKESKSENISQRDPADNAEQLELKKLPKSGSDDDSFSPRPVQDIFSAFYGAFTQTSPSPPLALSDREPFPSFRSSSGPFNSSVVTTFAIPQPFLRTHRLPHSFQSFQQRRRLFRDRHKQEARQILPSLDILKNSQMSLENQQDKNGSSSVTVEETARQLEFLAKKLDKSEHNKIPELSSLAGVESSSSVPLLLSSSSTSSTFLAPPKIAVSVAVSHSESVGPRGKNSTTGSTAIHHDDLRELARQRAGVGAKKNAKNERTFLGKEEKVFSGVHSSASTTPRHVPSRRPKPLIKTLPKYETDYIDARINNKNDDKNNFPRNFSRERDEDAVILPVESYNRFGEEIDVNGRVTSQESNEGKVSENNFHSLQDRHNIIPSSKDGREGDIIRVVVDASSIPSAESSSLIETARTSSLQRRKIPRTVSGEIGDPATYPFNLPKNNFQLPREVPSRTITQSPRSQPKVPNWQQPEKVWSEPARVWSEPAKVWGEPARVWSEPAKVWGNPAQVWRNPPQKASIRKGDNADDEMMQSDQPPEDRSELVEGETLTIAKGRETDDRAPQGTFVVLGDDENEGDSIDGDLGRPLMLHHFTIPPNPKESVSIRTSVSSSVSSTNNNRQEDESSAFSPRKVAFFPQSKSSPPTVNSQFSRVNSSLGDSSSLNVTNLDQSSVDNASNSTAGDPSQRKSGKKFGYVIEGANVRKYRVEERTDDGYIVGEYGVLNNQNAFLRGVRYTADGTINPRLIHEALMKFLSLRRK